VKSEEEPNLVGESEWSQMRGYGLEITVKLQQGLGSVSELEWSLLSELK
jgi:hypothetical protein